MNTQGQSLMNDENGHCPVLKSISSEMDEFREYLDYLFGEDCYAHDYAQIGKKHYYMVDSDRLDFIKKTLLLRFEKMWEIHNP